MIGVGLGLIPCLTRYNNPTSQMIIWNRGGCNGVFCVKTLETCLDF